MSNVVMSLNDRELTLLSDGILAMIGNAGQAKGLVRDTKSQDAIDSYMKELQRLNSKLCNADIR